MNEGLVVCVRGIISFFTLLIFTRVLGKQQLGQITFFDYILGITIGSFAASLTVDLSSAAWPHWVGLFTWTSLGVLMQFVSLKSIKSAEYINDEPTIVIHDGMVNGENLKKIKYTFNELLEQLRLKDIFDMNEVKLAVVEANGQLSVLKRQQFDDLLKGMKIPAKVKNPKEELIFNGIVLDDNLSKLNHDRKWLMEQLASQGYDSAVEVFCAFLDSSGKLKISAYEDMILYSKDIFK